MPPRNYGNRWVEIYFGPSTYTSRSKEEVADFIVEKMGLRLSGGGPKWTKGLTTLIEIGMEEWEDHSVSDKVGLEENSNDLLETIEDFHQEVKEFSSEQETDNSKDLAEAAKRVHRIEAQILEVLCRDQYLGAMSPNYVEIHELAEEVGVAYPVIYDFAVNLSRFPGGELVQFDLQGEKVKAVSEDAFEELCEARRLNPDSIGYLSKDRYFTVVSEYYTSSGPNHSPITILGALGVIQRLRTTQRDPGEQCGRP